MTEALFKNETTFVRHIQKRDLQYHRQSKEVREY